jgi:hypothetical protein
MDVKGEGVWVWFKKKIKKYYKQVEMQILY